ncbi:alpha/beta hydrolase fold domain-containing protein [Streptomyces sp. NPDC094034]|uniref:alpha/beta hydrolase fold domain-containing protein n=1 Tax=Streptomyces sp. NPDC094034 TaxID=3155309 RepID=UPI003322BE23
MSPAIPLTELLAAARSVTTTFDLIPEEPVPVADAGALVPLELSQVADRYARHGFAIIQLPPGPFTDKSLLALAESLGLGEPFLPPLYRLGGTVATVSRISAAANEGTVDADHPSFARTVGQELHCDGTLQDIGFIKASVLLCESPAAEGGDTTLFNASAAFARLLMTDAAAATALATPGVLIRQANVNGSTEVNSGPAFTVQDGQLICRYCVSGTDRWAVPADVTEADLWRGVEFMRWASQPISPFFARLRLGEGQAIVFDNTRISHGRSPYSDSKTQHRCLHRSLHLTHPRGVRTHQDQTHADTEPRSTGAARTLGTYPGDAPLGPPPALDPELAAPLRAILNELPMPLTPELIADRRARTTAGTLSDEAIRRGGAFDIEEAAFPGPPGAPDVRVIICRPTATPGPHPVIFNTHGGGMVAGNNRSIELADELDRAEELQLTVVAVEYRLAPEHPDPAPLDDCYAALLGTSENADRLRLDAERIIVSGNSAGGALAAGLALRARDWDGPRLLGQMLQCPMLDDRCDTPSAVQLARAGLWDGASGLAGWTALLGDRRGTDDVSGHTAPARATDLSNLPPAFVDVGSVEALRDECAAYAMRLWRAGGQAELHVWSGAFHSFDHWVPDAAVSQAAKRARISWMRRLLAS